jgi:drug/metabolite transporter (DMT)-like permease
MTADLKIVLLALLNASLLTGGVYFQKLNGVKGGSSVLSPWIALAFLCMAPTFFIGNLAFALGGRIGLFIPVTAVAYVFIGLMGLLIFKEPMSLLQGLGLVLIVAGIALAARPPG